ncbi:hypothetical protein BKA82DRAFT_36675 [Pisolithus tinctorius]|uniref:Uncharacterized protein n=1 Tax=Pisolithus tinctorius Marx 270 TaxID=870435 RepID=A0A0C3I6N4_PISTI|nr:hypothetical protein BKA82DRAFT_36675 [Pisolithus tinctorius]KIN92837.1 hypothetical protein M404DRAFT_36675 [Pisolithus tinctorius Marx 270]
MRLPQRARAVIAVLTNSKSSSEELVGSGSTSLEDHARVSAMHRDVDRDKGEEWGYAEILSRLISQRMRESDIDGLKEKMSARRE